MEGLIIALKDCIAHITVIKIDGDGYDNFLWRLRQKDK